MVATLGMRADVQSASHYCFVHFVVFQFLMKREDELPILWQKKVHRDTNDQKELASASWIGENFVMRGRVAWGSLKDPKWTYIVITSV